MVDRIGSNGLAREAILAAMKAHRENASRVADAARALEASRPDAAAAARKAAPAAAEGTEAVRPTDFARALEKGLAEVDREVRGADALPEDLIAGKVEDFHQVAAKVRQAELSFRFALEIRNKLVEAYREVMRMSV